MKKKLIFCFLLWSISISFAQNSSSYLQIGGVRDGNINTDEFVSKGISCIQSKDELCSFSIFVEAPTGYTHFPCLKNKLSDEFIEYSASLQSGKKLRLDSIRIKSGEKTILIPSKTYIIKRETPRCFIGKFEYAYELSADEILSAPFLACYPNRFSIASFDVSIADHERIKRVSNASSQFSDQLISEIKLLKGGETVWFEHVCARVNDSIVPLLPLKISVLVSNTNFPCTLNGISFGIWDNAIQKGELELRVPSKEVIIKSFTMDASVNGKPIRFSQNQGAKLTPEMVNFLRNASANTVVIIDQIFAEKEGVRLRLNPLFLKISGDEKMPKAALGNLSFGEQPMAVILKDPKITINGIPAHSFMVRTPQGHLFRADKGIIEPSQLEIIQNLPKGTVLHFYNISYISAGKWGRASDVWVKIR